jgi:hypothetical protein
MIDEVEIKASIEEGEWLHLQNVVLVTNYEYIEIIYSISVNV